METGLLLVGLLIGWWLGRRHPTEKTVMVYPSVRNAPLIYEVDRVRLRPNNTPDEPIKEDGGPTDDTVTAADEETVRVLREARGRGLG